VQQLRQDSTFTVGIPTVKVESYLKYAMVPPEIAVFLNFKCEISVKKLKLIIVPWFPMTTGPQCKRVISVNVRLTALFGSEDPTVQLISTKLAISLWI